MSFINKVKYNYFQNSLSDFIKTNNTEEIILLFEKLEKDNPKIYNDLFEKNIDNFIKITDLQKLFRKNLIWINAFNSPDLDIINKFLKYYFQNSNYSIYKYFDKVFECYQESLKFNDLIQKSYFIQNLITKTNQNIIMENTCAFFTTENNTRMFTHPFYTNCFIYVVRNPYDIYGDIKKIYKDKEISMNLLLNLDSQNDEYKNDNFFIEYPRKSWHVNLKSWADQKVISDYGGIIIKYEELMKNPFDFFSTIILHFKEKGENIEVDYNLINQFIDHNKCLFTKNREIELSNKEIKQIDKHVNNTMHDLNLSYSPN